MKTQLTWISIFSIAMAMLEAAVVIYLRALYYPEGFTVAMQQIGENILLTEIVREAATVVMLTGISVLAGRSFIQRFAFFLLSFAFWDIFYYVWLKMFIGWPESLLTWDILFLIPVTWLGPVLAPVLCSFTMILLALTLLTMEQQRPEFRLLRHDWLLLIGGSLLILYTFLKDYLGIIAGHGWLGEMDKLMQNEEFLRIASQYIPQSFAWPVFLAGEAVLVLAIFLLWIRNVSFKTTLYKWQ